MSADNMSVQIFGVEELQAFMRDLEDKDGSLVKEMRASVKKAINKTVKPYLYQIAREEYTATKKTLNPETKVKRSSEVYGHVLRLESNRVPLYGFKVSPKGVQDQKGRRLKDTIKDPETGEQINNKGEKRIKGPKVRVRQLSPPSLMEGVFVAKMKSGHIGLFKRLKGVPAPTNPKKEKIEELISISMAEMIRYQLKIRKEDKLGVEAIRRDLFAQIEKQVEEAKEKYKAKMAQEAAQ